MNLTVREGDVSPDALVGVSWLGDAESGGLRLLDQTQLPGAIVHLEIRTLAALREAIVALRVRGAPAIGIAAAYGAAQHLCQTAFAGDAAALGDSLEAAQREADACLRPARPTAVNLAWALDRIRDCFERHADHLTARELAVRCLLEARRIHREDHELCAQIAANGATLLPTAGGIYTHCNTGALATGGVGTALGCIRHAHANGHAIQVFAGETRPLLQGARLTVLELHHGKVPCHLVADAAAGHLMATGQIQAVIVGADRIAANGDTANKIGTYQLAVLARHHGIPFYVAAPYSTFDLTIDSGAAMTIEARDPDEVRRFGVSQTAPADIPALNPAFDVTPGALITAIICERGVITEPNAQRVTTFMAGSNDDRGGV